MLKNVGFYNQWLMQALEEYLGRCPDAIQREEVECLSKDAGIGCEEAFALFLAAILGLRIDEEREHREVYEAYFPGMIRCLRAEDYLKDPYYQNIRVPEKTLGRWCFQKLHYKPCEAFVYDDMERLEDGRILPKIGFFMEKEGFSYPAVLENGREWMLITPNEIHTMAPVIEQSFGRVLSYGLGMGYFAYMASEKPEVESITLVERDPEAIALFQEHILPQFSQRQKIRILEADAFTYAKRHMGKENYDFVFTDLWHDAGDGMELYLRMKELEKESPQSLFAYWIEKTIRCYLE